jgi:hypothetical protein
MNWDDVQLRGTPQLVVGVRDRRRRLAGYQVDVDKDVHPDLRQVAVRALDRVRAMDPVPYTPYVDPDEDEYLTIDATALTSRPIRRARGAAQEPPTEDDEHAALMRMILNSDYLERMGAGQLAASEEEFYAQAICLKHVEKRIGFVTRANPRQVLKRNRIYLGKHDREDRLTKITKPELVLESEVHAIVSETEIAVLNRNMFQNLVADTELITNYVPEQVRTIAKRFKGRGLTLSTETQTALGDAAAKSSRLAKRLSIFAERIDAVDVTAITSGKGFKASDLAKKDFVNAQGEIHCDSSRVTELLDALEGRFFGDPFSPEKRRADRFRRR